MRKMKDSHDVMINQLLPLENASWQAFDFLMSYTISFFCLFFKPFILLISGISFFIIQRRAIIYCLFLNRFCAARVSCLVLVFVFGLRYESTIKWPIRFVTCQCWLLVLLPFPFFSCIIVLFSKSICTFLSLIFFSLCPQFMFLRQLYIFNLCQSFSRNCSALSTYLSNVSFLCDCTFKN